MFWIQIFIEFKVKIADVSILDSPPSPMSASVSIPNTPPPLKSADVLYGRPLVEKKVYLLKTTLS